MFRFYFRNVDFDGLTITVDAKDREQAFNAVLSHAKRPSSWYLYHTRDLGEPKAAVATMRTSVR